MRRIIVAVLTLACAARIDAQSVPAAEARLREIIAAATRRDYATLLTFDGKFPEEIARIHGGSPRYEWAELDKAVKARRMEDLSPSSANTMGLGALVTWTAFPHRVVDVEASPNGTYFDSFVTFDYTDPQRAPIYFGAVVRRVVLDIKLDRTLKVDFVNMIDAKLKHFENLAPRITDVAWNYSAEGIFTVGFVGGQWPVTATFQCGTLAAVTRKSDGRSMGIPEFVPEIAFRGMHVNEPSTCSFAIEDASGAKDAVRFETAALGNSGHGEYRCWPRPEFRDFWLILRTLQCNGATGTLTDAKDFRVGGGTSEPRGTPNARATEAPSGDSAAMLIGRWTRPDGIELFGADGTYSVTYTANARVFSGKWWQKGNHLVILTTSVTEADGRRLEFQNSPGDYVIVGLSRDSLTTQAKNGRRILRVRTP